MSRLLKDCPQQHSLPGVLPFDQIESVTLVDAKWTQLHVDIVGHACAIGEKKHILARPDNTSSRHFDLRIMGS